MTTVELQKKLLSKNIYFIVFDNEILSRYISQML